MNGCPPYFVGLPDRRAGKLAWSSAEALQDAQRLASSTGRVAHIHATRGRPGHIGFEKGCLLLRISPSGALGDTLTDWACESATFAESWRGRVDDALDTATTAAVLGAGAAGLLGALVKRPLLGAALGAITGWTAAAIWTAPQRPSA